MYFVELSKKKVNAVKNEEASQVSRLEEEIRALKRKLAEQQQTASASLISSPSAADIAGGRGLGVEGGGLGDARSGFGGGEGGDDRGGGGDRYVRCVFFFLYRYFDFPSFCFRHYSLSLFFLRLLFLLLFLDYYFVLSRFSKSCLGLCPNNISFFAVALLGFTPAAP